MAAPALTASCTSASERPLRVATVPWPGYQPLLLAQSLGYVDTARVRLVELANNTQAAAAMRAGMVDAATVTLDEALVLLQDGVDLRVVLVMDASNGADAVLARPEIATLPALRGKRIAVEAAAVGAVMLDAVLSEAGLSSADIRLVTLPVNLHAHAYAEHMVDAVVTYEPVRSQLLALGARVVFDSRQIPGRIVDVLAVRAEAMENHRAGLTQLVAAHFRALDYLSRQPADAYRRIAPYLRVAPDLVRPQFDGLALASLADNGVQLSGASPTLPGQMAALDTLMFRRNLLRMLVPLTHLVDDRFLPPATP